MDKYINSLIQSITDMRNDRQDCIKLDDFRNFKKYERQAIAKLAIEQILNIRNYLTILDQKGVPNE